MLISLDDLRSATVEATDGEIGKVKDVYFDDRFWTIRYLVVDTQPWIPMSTKLLISPVAVEYYDAEKGKITTSSDKHTLENCPRAEEHQPISRKFEKVFFDYFGFGYYWNGPGVWGNFEYPIDLQQRVLAEQNSTLLDDKSDDTYLRSAEEVLHYDVKETDGTNGSICNFIWNTDTWSLAFLVINTRDWFPGGDKVLITPKHFSNLRWQDNTVTVDLTTEQIESCPKYEAQRIHDEKYVEQVKLQLAKLM